MKNICELRSPTAWDAVKSLGFVEHLVRLAPSEAQDSASLLSDLLFLSSSSMYGVDPTHREHRCSCFIKASETSYVWHKQKWPLVSLSLTASNGLVVVQTSKHTQHPWQKHHQYGQDTTN